MNYQLFIDSLKLFFVNVFLFALFLESYAVASVLQARYPIELPFAPLFVMGVFTFLMMIVWTNIATSWYRRIKSSQEMLARSLYGELPFILMLLLFWILLFTKAKGLVPDVRGLLYLFCWYMVAFPAVMVLTKSHRENA